MTEDVTVADRVVAILTQRLGISADVVTLTAELAEDLGVDSVDAVEFTLALEREFNVALPDESITDVRTVQDVVDLVYQRTALSEPARG
jgi:acyl carrier protein